MKKSFEQLKDERLYKTYGITLIDFNVMAADGCNICGTKEGRLCVDHIHVAGFKKMPPEEKFKYVRGILCFLCNTGIKGFDKTKDGKKNRNRLNGTFKYFQTYSLKGEI
jgi:Recombination endonuclease VII